MSDTGTYDVSTKIYYQILGLCMVVHRFSGKYLEWTVILRSSGRYWDSRRRCLDQVADTGTLDGRTDI